MVVGSSVSGRQTREKESYRSYFLTALGHTLQIKERTLLDKLTILICLTDNHMERTSNFTHPGSPSLGKAVSRNEELEAKTSASFQEGGREDTMVMIQ